jgi:mycoredoxin-dependent peroxiredoxin
LAIGVGAEAPDFVLKDQNNHEIGLSSFRGRLAVLIVFYPYAFTGVCRSELGAVRDALDDFQNSAVQILTISVDSVFSHKVWALQEGYSFPLLADFWPHGAVASAYGVLDPKTGAANRGTFLVDRGGVIRFAEMNGPGEPRDPDAWRRALAALTDVAPDAMT